MDNDVLKFALDNGIIDISCVQEKYRMNKRNEILKRHPYKIWEGKDGKWYTYLKDEKRGRVLRKRNTEESLIDLIVEAYQSETKDYCFADAYHEWIKEKEEFSEIGRSSITRYEKDFKRFFDKDDDFCNIKLCDMTESDLELFIKRSIKNHGLTAKGYAGLRTLLIGTLKYAKREKYTDFSVGSFFNDFSLPKNMFRKKVKRKENEVFTLDELKKLIPHLEEGGTKKDYAVLLQIYSGVRVGELTALKRGDNAERNHLFICRTEYVYYDENEGKHITTVKEYPKTDDGVRDIVIPQKAQSILDRLKIQVTKDDFLFSECGQRISSKQINYHLKKVCRESGIIPKSTHKLRRSYISLLLSEHADDALVQKQVGHKEISTTQKYYHYDILPDSEKVDFIDRIVSFN